MDSNERMEARPYGILSEAIHRLTEIESGRMESSKRDIYGTFALYSLRVAKQISLAGAAAEAADD
jgi:hypothetical protein